MRALLFGFVFTLGVSAQPIGFGIKGGLPLQDAFDVATRLNPPSSNTQFTVGPMVDLRLPLGFGIEADALYNRYNLNFASLVGSGGISSSVEIPILIKYRVGHAPLIHPYIEAGPDFRKLFNIPTNITGAKVETTGKGVAIGAGVEFRLLFLRISPEIRYTRWANQSFTFGSVLSTAVNLNPNQAQFLVGLSW